MAIQYDDCEPNAYKPARAMAPEGTVNTSAPEAGGQLHEPAGVMPTPSMVRTDTGVKGNSGVWDGPTDATAGTPPAD